MNPLVLALVAASVPGVDVAWRGDARCPAQGFQDDLARYLAGATTTREVAVDVTVLREGEGRWSARLVLAADGARRTRVLRGRSCAEISDAAAFVTAVVVDPGVLARPEAGVVPAPEGGDMSSESGDEGAVSEAPAGPQEGAPAVEADAGANGQVAEDMPSGPAAPVGKDLSLEAGVPEPAAEPEKAPVQESPRRGFVRVAGGVEALGLPHVGPLAALAGGVRGRGWRVEASALYRGPTTQFSAAAPTAGARVRLWAIGARGCGVPRVRRVEFPLCAGLEVGQALGEGVGYAGARRDGFVWVAAVLGPALAWAPRPWLALWVGAELGLPLRRGTFAAAGLGTMFEIAPVSLRAGLGVEVRFGRGGPTDPRRAGK